MARPGLFKQLQRLFKSGTVVRRKVRSIDTTVAVPDATKSSGALLMQRSSMPTYANITMNAYNISERLVRYQDFVSMELTPELAAALDVYADECVSPDEKNKVLHIYSNNEKLRQDLYELFYGVVNVEFNLRPWVRNLCKYGDLFTLLDVHPEHGVVNVVPIPVNEIEREEGYDPEDPWAVRFKWSAQIGERALENWEVAHFRLLGNDAFLPYGASVVEPARRIWRQLILAEDAMLVYRVTRAPERRVHYIDTGNLPPDAVDAYMEKQKTTIRTSQVVDNSSGRVDIRYNPFPIRKDTPVPLLDGTSMTIEAISRRMADEPSWTPWVYSIKDDTHSIVPGKVTWCGRNYAATELVKVWLDDETYVTTAPEHPFVMRDGTRKRADELESGDSLMPFYRELSDRGYELCYSPSDDDYVPTHQLVARDVYPHEWKTTKARTVHHKRPWEPNNKTNNAPDNLQVMTLWEHRKWHVDHIKLTLHTPENLAANAARLTAYNQSEKKLKRVSELNKQRNSVEAMKGYNGSKLHKEHNEVRRAAQKRSWSENRQARRKSLTWVFPDEVFDIAAQKLRADPTLNRDRFCAAMISDPAVVRLLQAAQSNKEDVRGISYRTWVNRIRDRGFSGFDEYKKSVLGDGYVRRLNHKVVRIERLTVEPEDVYCMTVVGVNGEDDRHNFAVQSCTSDGVVQGNGIIIQNSIEEDYWVPVRGQDSGTRIETLAGGQNTAAVEDVAYLRDKLFTAIKIPKPYLGYSDSNGSKASLSQLDIRFSRTIQSIQKVVVAELNKIAIVHLYTLGYTGDDLLNFTLNLSNPSTVAQQQKLELWRARMEIASTVPENMASRRFVRQQIWGLTDDECTEIDNDRYDERLIDMAVDDVAAAGASEADASSGSGGGAAGGVGGMDDLADPSGDDAGDEESGGDEGSDTETASHRYDDELILAAMDRDDASLDEFKSKIDTKNLPAKIANHIDHVMYNRSRLRHAGAQKTDIPDFVRMTGIDGPSMDDPYDLTGLKSVVSNPLADVYRPRNLSSDSQRLLENLQTFLGSARKRLADQRLLLRETKQLSLFERQRAESDDEGELVIVDDRADAS